MTVSSDVGLTVRNGMTRDNWRKHPHAPWAFANVDAFLPAMEVRGGLAAPIPESPWRSGPTDFEAPSGGRVSLDRFLDGTHSDGFIVLDRGRLVFEQYRGLTAPGSRHLCFSITKSLVGLMADLLIGCGVLRDGTRVSAVVPELTSSAFANAELRALLDMRDGVPFDENYADPSAQIHAYSKHFWGSGDGGVLAALGALPRTDPAPGQFAYRTPVTDVVGLVIERATGMRLAELASDLMWRQIGAERPAAWITDTDGREIASAGFACTLRDLARFGHWLGQAAIGNGPGSLVMAARSILAGGDRAAFAAAGLPTRQDFSYRSGWWIDHGSGAINALGVFGQRLHIRPAQQIVIARFGSHPIASNEHTDALHAAAFGAIAQHLSGA